MSNRVFVDTNLFIRLFTDDDPQQVKAVLTLFQTAQANQLALVTNVMVIAEIVWVLESVFHLSANSIRKHVWSILNTPAVDVIEAELISQAIDTYASQNIDFIDAYNAAWMRSQGIQTIYTFDERHFRRVQGLDVRVPKASSDD